MINFRNILIILMILIFNLIILINLKRLCFFPFITALLISFHPTIQSALLPQLSSSRMAVRKRAIIALGEFVDDNPVLSFPKKKLLLGVGREGGGIPVGQFSFKIHLGVLELW